jgi:hypothetical protein
LFQAIVFPLGAAMPPVKVYDFDPHNLPPDVLQAIGLITACSAQNEYIINQGIGGCLGVDIEYTDAVTTHMTSPHRDNVLRAVAEIKIDSLDDLDALDILLDTIDEGFRKRNGYVHRSWCRDPQTNECFTVQITARGRVEVGLAPMSVEEIVKDADFIYDAGIALHTFLSERGLLPPVPAKPRPRAHKSKAARKARRKKP